MGTGILEMHEIFMVVWMMINTLHFPFKIIIWHCSWALLKQDRPHHLNGEYIIESTRHPPVVYLQPHEHMK
ncbi:unnamed protein product [Prunus armeniaca]|uniref:Uncharacterized protein n=1 Tax=Prunus armeniaca TaxID=36596 RepID=A0A6J5XB50_PRUAR|nr:unnamed protein product [Prunus armeniaca]